MHIHSFAIISPLERGYPLVLIRFKFPSPKDDLCQVWSKLAQWFWKKRFLNDLTPFLRLSSFEADLALYLNKLQSPLPKDNLHQV